ncbi:hypothetical protein JNB63_07740 [Microbacterium trichothecenolyticum]|uniref:hypothetical protein n=1 Tax=Microbacterium trichothecenolyticum TaxID=69370 RepID=UPI001C6DF325|nr:hypothetical protein [Microbacterium trichothecenolyticum]MBW9119979.1 hypothetical protein [Microbacterium trichothecenolyticum]
MEHDCGCGHAAHAGQDSAPLEFSADGEVILPDPIIRPEVLTRACPLGALDGSWLLELQRRTVFGPEVRGAMRIEVGTSSLRVSGDMYSRRVFPPVVIPEFEVQRPFPVPGPGPEPFGGPAPIPGPDPAPFGGDADADSAERSSGAQDEPPVLSEFPAFDLRWYPAFPASQYSWYFRSNGATYADGTLTVQIVRHLWNRTTQEFVSTDTGTLVLRCRRPLVVTTASSILNPAQRMTGTLSIGGTVTNVTATKTSPMYRGCRIEVDAMVNRTFPASATIGSGAAATVRSVYATAGWDVTVVTDEIAVPDDADLTNAELATLMTGHRQVVSGEQWRLWLFIGSSQGGLFGIMFDDDTVPREGAAGFADVELGDDSFIAAAARGRPLDEVPAAFLRTLVHEAGHAFNLWHPKHDVHNPGIGIEIMNQTGDVMGFATVANPYPGNAAFVFSDHDRTSLIHSPDPQVRPGWKNFGWGHGSLSAGLPAPVDVAGLAGDTGDDALELTVAMPAQAFVGEYVTAEVVLTNVSDQPRTVTTLINLSEGDLVFLHTPPDRSLEHLVDVAIGCGPRPTTVLQPGESIRGHVQVFFTNQGVTFTEPGRHTVAAQLEVDPVTTVRSAPVTVDVRGPASDAEVDISAKTLTPGVGRAIALGDFATDAAARAVLTDLAEQHSDTDTGAAGALVLANALARSFTDVRARGVRDAAPDEAAHFLELALQGRSPERVAALAVTVASPSEKNAPVVADTIAALRSRTKGGARSAAGKDVAAAERIAEDFVRPQAR